MEVIVGDFDNILKTKSDINSADLINLTQELPTELFPIKKKTKVEKFLEECRKCQFYRSIKSQLDQEVDLWVIATYDPYTLPMLYCSGLRKKQIVPIVHYSKYFRKVKWKFYGITSFWVPHLLFNNLCKNGFFLYLLEEHKDDVLKKGYKGECAYLPYNAISENNINMDNRHKLNNTFRICTVGLIRDDKDIRFVMEAVKGKRDIEYFVGGKVDKTIPSSYINSINEIASRCDNIITRFEYLPNSEYNSQIEKSHFTIIPINDKYAKGVQLTGLMLDSLVNKRPFIGPDIFPINKFVRNYGVGLVYENGSLESLVQTLEFAKAEGIDAYYENICRFLRENSVERTALRLRNLFEAIGSSNKL